MKHIFVAGMLLTFTGFVFAQSIDVNSGSDDGHPSVTSALTSTLHEKRWNHGSSDCKSNTDPAIEVFRYDQSSFILRQNKCLSFEAPFIYVLLGNEKALVLDTGATKSALDFPLYETVQALIGEQTLLVLHSHSHSDHYASDHQFKGKPNVTLVSPNETAMTQFFDFDDWPNGEASIDLGGRELIIIPTPGHQEEAISVYDPHTQWLLTGDTFYPGYLYIKNWIDYKKSIARLVSFSDEHDISVVLGAHIEMTRKAGEYYPIGTTFQPNEARLALEPEDLAALNSAIITSNGPKEIVLDKFILAPMNALQKFISNTARWLIQ